MFDQIEEPSAGEHMFADIWNHVNANMDTNIQQPHPWVPCRIIIVPGNLSKLC